jgi:hypothetical protein
LAFKKRGNLILPHPVKISRGSDLAFEKTYPRGIASGCSINDKTEKIPGPPKPWDGNTAQVYCVFLKLIRISIPPSPVGAQLFKRPWAPIHLRPHIQ